MPSSTYYIRVRGRVRGPYDIARLKLLYARGQLSRAHQVSTDGTQWVSAGTLNEIFSSPRLIEPQLVSSDGEDDVQWYYQQDEQSCGPVPASQLRDMIAVGDLTSRDSICEVGATQWSTVEEVWPDSKVRQSVIYQALFGIVTVGALIGLGIVSAIYLTPNPSVTGPLDDAKIRDAVGMVVCGKRIVRSDGVELEIPESLGTCFFVSADGYAITNGHVVSTSFRFVKNPELLDDQHSANVKDVKEVVRVYIDGEGYDAEMIHNSERFDLAVIKVDRPDGAFFQLSSVEEAERNLKVFALGYPTAGMKELTTFDVTAKKIKALRAKRFRKHFNESDFVYNQTEGTVSRSVEKQGQGLLFQHTAVISKGSSGGPLIDVNGVVVGINTFRVAEGNVYYALSTAQLKRELDKHVPDGTWR